MAATAAGPLSVPGTAAAADYSPSVTAQGAAIGYWPLDEAAGPIARDVVAGHHGLYPDPAPAMRLTGAILGSSRTATWFDGRDQRATTSGVARLTNDFSAEAWVRLDPDGVAGGGGWIIGDESTSTGWRLAIDDAHKAVVEAKNSAGTFALKGTTAIDTTRWHHVVGTLAGGRTMTLWVDGTQVATKVASGQGAAASSKPVTLAGAPAGDAFFNGALDEVAVYGRALSAAEIGAHFNDAGRGTAPVPAIPSWPRPDVYFGPTDNGVWRGDLSSEDDARLNAGLGANSARVTILWPLVQPSATTYTWKMADRIYSSLRARRIRPLWTVLRAPAWTSPITCPGGHTPSCNEAPGPTHLTDLNKLVVAIAKRYPQSAAIEMWNEPNLYGNWIQPYYYVQMMLGAHEALLSSGSKIPLLAGALGDTSNESNYQKTLPHYLQDLYRFGLKGTADGLSFHPYQCGWCQSTAIALATDVMARRINDVVSIRNAAGDSAMPLWLDEWGLSTTQVYGTVDDFAQATGLVSQYRYAMATAGIKAAYIYTLVEPGTGSNPSDGYGLVRRTLELKPAYCAIARERGMDCP